MEFGRCRWMIILAQSTQPRKDGLVTPSPTLAGNFTGPVGFEIFELNDVIDMTPDQRAVLHLVNMRRNTLRNWHPTNCNMPRYGFSVAALFANAATFLH